MIVLVGLKHSVRHCHPDTTCQAVKSEARSRNKCLKAEVHLNRCVCWQEPGGDYRSVGQQVGLEAMRRSSKGCHKEDTAVHRSSSACYPADTTVDLMQLTLGEGTVAAAAEADMAAQKQTNTQSPGA